MPVIEKNYDVNKSFDNDLSSIKQSLNKPNFSFFIVGNLKKIIQNYSKLDPTQKKRFEELKTAIAKKFKEKNSQIALKITKMSYVDLFNNRKSILRIVTISDDLLETLQKPKGLRGGHELGIQKQFTVLFSHIIQQTKREYTRLIAKKDYRSLSRLLAFIKIGNHFTSRLCSLNIKKKYKLLRVSIFSHIATLNITEIKKHLDKIAGSMVNLRNSMKPSTRLRLKKIQGVEELGQKLYITVDGKKWQITISYWDKKIPKIKKILISLKGKENQIYSFIDFNKLTPDGTHLNLKNIRAVIKQAHGNFRKQEQNSATLKKFDLPKNRKIGYIHLFPVESDKVINTFQMHAALMPKILTSQGYKLDLTAMKGLPFRETNNPKATLIKQLDQLYKKGIRDFYISLSGHGKKYGISIGRKFSGQDMTLLIKKYPNCKFTFTSPTCYGGGFRKALLAFLKKNPRRAKDVNLFLQTKPSTVNVDAMLDPKTKETYSTYYDVFFAKFLLKGLSYGEAAYLADVETQKMFPTNPEAIVNGILISENKRTKRNLNFT